MALAHLGFALVLVGALISNAKKEAISTNANFIHENFPSNEHIALDMDSLVSMYPYYVRWEGERTEGNNRLYTVQFYEVSGTYNSEDERRKHLVPAFTLEPFIQMNKRMGNVREPSTKHYWDRDIYTYVSYADLRPIPEDDGSEWMESETIKMQMGDDRLAYNQFMIHADSLKAIDASFDPNTGVFDHLELQIDVTVSELDSVGLYPIRLSYFLDHNQPSAPEVDVPELGIKLQFNRIEDEEGTYSISVWKKKVIEEQQSPFILMQAFVFPYINLLWLGSILMGIGTLMAVWKRIYRSLTGQNK
jgi:cytochrome c-type biogenesis protein CcmF